MTPLLSWMDRGPIAIDWRADAEVDAIVSDADDIIATVVIDDLLRWICGSTRCKSCGVQGSAFGFRHAPDCDLDLTVSARTRWTRRNPEHQGRIVATNYRLRRIRQSWAALNGRCRLCVSATAADGCKYCDPCLARARTANRAAYARRVEAKAAA